MKTGTYQLWPGQKCSDETSRAGYASVCRHPAY